LAEEILKDDRSGGIAAACSQLINRRGEGRGAKDV
jgi:hypothetical protein